MKRIIPPIKPEETKTLPAAFPSQLRSDVEKVLNILPAGIWPTEQNIGSVHIWGQPVIIPWRIYLPMPSALPSLSNIQCVIFAGIYSRHHNGFVREKHLDPLFAANTPWLCPFLLQLVGEAVVEIVAAIEQHVGELDPVLYAQFAEEIPNFLALTRNRVISY